MNGKSVGFRYAVRNSCVWAESKKLDLTQWRKNLKMARGQARLTIAKRNKEGLEYSFALVDKDRKIIKKVMMTPNEAYKRNKVTKLAGLAWVLCG